MNTRFAFALLPLVAAPILAGCFESSDYDDDYGYSSSSGGYGSYGPCGYSPCPDAGASAKPLPASGLRVFVSSSSYPGDLATAGGASTGLAGADALCTDLARGAGLTTRGRWVAWLSDSKTDASTRVVDGKSGFYTVRGDLVMSQVRAMQAGRPDSYITVDEEGTSRSYGAMGWTGSTNTGAKAPSSCADWTSSDARDFGAVSGSSVYAAGGAASCAQPQHLYCFEQELAAASTDAGTSDAGDAGASDSGDGGAQPSPPDKKRVFVTSTKTTGTDVAGLLASGGPEAVDAICDGLATGAGLPGSYRAWIAARDSVAGPVAPVGRVSLVHDYWDATLTTRLFAAGTFDAPLAPIAVTETGARVAEGDEVWVGALPRAFCTDYASADEGVLSLGTAGLVARAGWQDGSGLRACGQAFRLYCFER